MDIGRQDQAEEEISKLVDIINRNLLLKMQRKQRCKNSKEYLRTVGPLQRGNIHITGIPKKEKKEREE